MAHGLRTIANKGYSPDGTGRDWFFLGDFDYRHGRLTPSPVSSKQRPPMTRLLKPRSVPAEVRHSRSCAAAKSAKEKWMCHHEGTAPGVGGAPQPQWHSSTPLAARTAPAASPFQATSWQLGQLPGWSGKRFELPRASELATAGVIGCERINPPTPGPGDHTRGVKGGTAHFAASSWQVGQQPGWAGAQYESSRATELRRAGVLRSESAPDLPPPGAGDHTCGIGAGLAQHSASSAELGPRPSDWKPKDQGAADRHHYHSTPIFPRQSGEGTIDAAAAVTGDHTRGIKGRSAHFAPTSSQYGQDPAWKGRRYDFGPVAFKQHRLTPWGDRQEER